MLKLFGYISLFKKFTACSVTNTNYSTIMCGYTSLSYTNLPLKFVFYFAAAKSLQSCPTLCDPIDSPPGSPVLGILQARTLEWAAIAFSVFYLSNSRISEFCLCQQQFSTIIGRLQSLCSNKCFSQLDIFVFSYTFKLLKKIPQLL